LIFADCISHGFEVYISVGIEHFFDAFCYCPQRPWRAAAIQALGIPSCHIAEDTHITKLEDNKFTLTPRRIPVEWKATASNSRADVVMDAGEQSDAESGWSGVSDNSSTDSDHLRGLVSGL